MSFGLLPTGFVAKTLSDIQTELETTFREQLGENINLNPEESVLGVLVGILAEREALLWDLAQAVYSASDPNQATGSALDAVCALTGTIRLDAAPSTVTAYCIGTNGTVLPAGRVVSVADSGQARFASTEEKTIATVSAWTISTAYAVGTLVSNSGNVYLCTDAGASAGSGGPTTTGSAIVDGGCIWHYLGAGSACVAVPFESEEDGAIVATSGSLTTIETPVSGWSLVTNAEDADLGRDIETDSELRERRNNELIAQGNAPLNAIRANVLAVDDVTSCKVFQNTTDVTDGDGLPPHSIEVMVEGGDDTEIAQAIFDSVAAGIATYGSDSVEIADDTGSTHEIFYTRPTEIPIYVIINVVKDVSLFPSDGSDQIKAALTAYVDALSIGNDVVSMALKARAFSIAGMVNITTCFIGIAPAPASETTITIGVRERATLDTANITVNLSNGSL
jgi:uncharacterized phage protein gp47/JayE